jgi:hypothetical protein
MNSMKRYVPVLAMAAFLLPATGHAETRSTKAGNAPDVYGVVVPEQRAGGRKADSDSMKCEIRRVQRGSLLGGWIPWLGNADAWSCK